jgi:antitoxin component of RelBE/YafQ-DinJ toxin-antitoxin module
MELQDWILTRRGIQRANIVFRVPYDIRRRLRVVASKKGLTVSELLRLWIDKCLKEEEKEEKQD